MANAYFTYKGKKSSDFGLRIHNDMVLTIPGEDIELLDVVGVDGEIAISNGRLKGINKPFTCSLFVPNGETTDSMATKISEWLRTDVGWSKLTFSGYAGYEFEAICYETLNIEETLRTFGKTVINFRLKPYKFKIGSRDAITVTTGQTLTNPEKRISKPLIEITGSGNITIKNNGSDWLILTSVDGNITIDSATMTVYKGITSQFDKMNANLKPLFPVLKTGANVITWTGTITNLKITPRWEAVV